MPSIQYLLCCKSVQLNDESLVTNISTNTVTSSNVSKNSDKFSRWIRMSSLRLSVICFLLTTLSCSLIQEAEEVEENNESAGVAFTFYVS